MLIALVMGSMPLTASAGLLDGSYSVTYGAGTSMCPSPYNNTYACPSGVGGIFGVGGLIDFNNPQAAYYGGYSSGYAPSYGGGYYQQPSYNYQYQQPTSYAPQYTYTQPTYAPSYAASSYYGYTAPSYGYSYAPSYGYNTPSYSYGYAPAYQYQYAAAGYSGYAY